MPALNKRATEDLYDTLTEAADENKAGGLILNLGSSYITPAAYLDAALFVMSSGAAGMTATEAAARGATADQVMTLGTMAGAAEYLTEKIPLNDLFKIFGAGRTAAKQSLRQIARQAGEEGLEEFISEYVNTVSDNLIKAAGVEPASVLTGGFTPMLRKIPCKYITVLAA